MIRRFAEHAAISYCQNQTALEALSGLNLRTGFFEVLVDSADYLNRINYYATFNPTTRILTFVFRGSTNKQDALLDLTTIDLPLNLTTLPLKNVSQLDDPRVHAGFYGRFAMKRSNATRNLRNAVNQIHSKYGSEQPFSTVVVGHSLGAAWAMLQAADWVNQGFSIDAFYSFGQPIVGNAVAADGLAETIGLDKYIRIVNRNDIIPHLGYAPGGAHSRNANEQFVAHTGEDQREMFVQTCNGGQDPRCSLSIDCMKWSWFHHSEVELLQLRSSFCRNNIVTSNSVYE